MGRRLPMSRVRKHIELLQNELARLQLSLDTASLNFATCCSAAVSLIADCRYEGTEDAAPTSSERTKMHDIGVEALQLIALAAQVEFVQFQPDLSTLSWRSPECHRRITLEGLFATRCGIMALDMDELHATDPRSEECLDIVNEIFEYASGCEATAEFDDGAIFLHRVLNSGGKVNSMLFEYVALALMALARSHSGWFARDVFTQRVELWGQLVPGTGIMCQPSSNNGPINPCTTIHKPRTHSPDGMTDVQREVWILIHDQLDTLLRMPADDLLPRADVVVEIVNNCITARWEHATDVDEEFLARVFKLGAAAVRSLDQSCTHFFNIPKNTKFPIAEYHHNEERGPRPQKHQARELRRWTILKALDQLHENHALMVGRIRLMKDVLTFAVGLPCVATIDNEQIKLSVVNGAGAKWKREMWAYARHAISGMEDTMTLHFRMDIRTI